MGNRESSAPKSDVDEPSKPTLSFKSKVRGRYKHTKSGKRDGTLSYAGSWN